MPGIIDFSVRFPSGVLKVPDLQSASGVPLPEILEITHTETIPVLGDHEQAWELAADAGRDVLERCGVDPRSVGYVLYAGSGEWDLPFWSPAAKVAAELDIRRAHCFEVANFCNATMTAVQLAADKIALGRAEHVLVLSGDRLAGLVDHGDPDSKPLFNFGDAPAAILLGAHGVRFEVTHSAMRTDPAWADYYSGEIAEDRIYMRRRGHRKGLGDAYVRNFVELVSETLGELELPLGEIAFLLMNQGDRGMHERLLDTLGVPREKSVFSYDRLGHMGGSDPFIALRGLLDEHRLSDGDTVLVASSGMGFSWGVTALRYGS